MCVVSLIFELYINVTNLFILAILRIYAAWNYRKIAVSPHIVFKKEDIINANKIRETARPNIEFDVMPPAQMVDGSTCIFVLCGQWALFFLFFP